MADQWPDRTLREQIPIVQQLVSHVEISRKQVRVELERGEIFSRLMGAPAPESPKHHRTWGRLVLKAKVMFRRSGIESKLVFSGGPPPSTHQRSVKALQKALLKSLQWNEALLSGEVDSFEALIRRDNLNARQTHRLRKLAFLAPDIMEAIIAGQIPETLTLESLKRDFPVAWDAQRRHFGFR